MEKHYYCYYYFHFRSSNCSLLLSTIFPCILYRISKHIPILYIYIYKIHKVIKNLMIYLMYEEPIKKK